MTWGDLRMNKFIIAGIGELLWDVLPHIEVIGGAPVNFAYHVTSLGARGIPVSTIGRDSRGERALAQLQERGLDIRGISLSDDHATGYVTALLDNEGRASYSFPNNVAWDHLQVNDYAEKLRTNLDAVCFGSLAQRSGNSRRAIYGFLDALGEDTLKVFDVNFRQNFYSLEIIESSLIRTDILKINDDELPVVCSLLELKGSDEKCLMTLIERYQLKMAILTRGGNGSILMSPARASKHRGIATHIKDTIGAGDSFTAVATIGFLQGLGLDEINEKANRLAAYVCSQQGAMVPVPEPLKLLV